MKTPITKYKIGMDPSCVILCKFIERKDEIIYFEV